MMEAERPSHLYNDVVRDVCTSARRPGQQSLHLCLLLSGSAAETQTSAI